MVHNGVMFLFKGVGLTVLGLVLLVGFVLAILNSRTVRFFIVYAVLCFLLGIVLYRARFTILDWLSNNL